MSIQYNELLGHITQLVINIRDERILNAAVLDGYLRDYNLTLSDLQSNKSFVIGVWSGFTWDQGVEAYFWRRVLSYKAVEVTEITESDTLIDDPDTSKRIDDEVSAFISLGEEDSFSSEQI